MRISRRSRYVAAGVGLFLVGSVVFNVGFPTTKGDRAADLRSLASHVASDMASCNSSIGDSFAAYTDVVQGDSSKRSAAISLINGNEPYCTPVGNTDLYDLDTLEVPGSLHSYDLQPALQQLGEWAYPDGADAMSDVSSLLSHPGDAAARSDLRARLQQMAALDASAAGAFGRAAAALGTTVVNLDLGAADRLGPGSF